MHPSYPPIGRQPNTDQITPTPPWGDKGRRRIWGSRNSLTPGIPWLLLLSCILEGILVCQKYLGTWVELTTRPDNTQGLQTMEESLNCMVQTSCFWAAFFSPLCQDCVVQTSCFRAAFLVIPCLPCPTPLLLAQDLSIVNGSIVFSLPPSLADNTTFFMLLFSNSHLLLLNWKGSRHTKMMSLFRVLFVSFITCVRHRFT